MSNIQQNFNQMLTTVGIMNRLSPNYENKVQANNILGRAKSASVGLKETEKGLYEKNKSYSKTQLDDIANRTKDLNSLIYDAKIRGKEGDPLARYISKGLKGLPQQDELAKTLTSIETRLETLRGQQAGLAERKEILKDPEAAMQKRILQMKNAAARNENREKAIAGIVPKGGAMPQTEIENTNIPAEIPVKEPELPVENAPIEEPVAEETVIDEEAMPVHNTDMENDPLYKGVELAERGSLENKKKIGNTQIFTPQKYVDKMVELSAGENGSNITDFNRTWLEPTSGEGAYTTNVLARRMRHSLDKFTTPKDFFKNTARALSTIYSIEPMGDTHARQVGNLRKILDNSLSEFEKKNNITIDKNSPEYKEWKKFTDDVISKNIIHGYFGDTLEKIAKMKGKQFKKQLDDGIIGYMADKKTSDIDYNNPIKIYDFKDDDYFKGGK